MIPSLARRVLGKVGQAQIKKLSPIRFPFSFSKTWRGPATVKPVLESNFRRLPAVAWLFVAFLSAALTVRGAEESVVRIDRSRDGIKQLRSDLIEWGCSREMSNKVLELTRQSDLRADEIELVVHYAVFCTGPNAGEVFINSLIANRDFKEVKLRSSRTLVYDAFRYFGNEGMARVLNDIEGFLLDPEEAKVASLSDADIRREIEKFKDSPDPDLRDRLRDYCNYLIRLRRMEVVREINAALLESDPSDPDLLHGKGTLDAIVGDFVVAKEAFAKAWQKKLLKSLIPYAGVIIQTDDLPAAASLADDLIRYQKWDEQIPKALIGFAFIMQKEPERYRATIEKILANVDAVDLKDAEGKQLHERLMHSRSEVREKD